MVVEMWLDDVQNHSRGKYSQKSAVSEKPNRQLSFSRDDF